MAKAEFTKAALAAALIRKHPQAPARSLATRLRKDHPQVFASVENARGTIRYVLGANGDAHRKQIKDKSLVRPVRAAGEKPKLPASVCEPWIPFLIEAPARVLVINDLHIPYHDNRAIREAVKFAKKRHNVNALLINGDLGDWYTLSRFLKNPAKRDLYGELKTQRQGLEYLKSEFPRCRRILKKGNHDERWDHWVWEHAAELSDLPELRLRNILQLDRLGFDLVDRVPVMIGEHLPAWHGHELGGGIFAPVNVARGGFVRTLHAGLVAHHHQSSNHVEYDVFKKEIAFWSVGCLSELHPYYRPVNKFNLGFAVVELARTNLYNVHNYRMGAHYQIRTA